MDGPPDPPLETLETDAVVTDCPLDAIDGPALRRELALRILLQNLLLILSLALFAAFGILAMTFPETVWLAAAAHGAAGLGAVLQWCHHGIRTKQIKEYLLLTEGERQDGWEKWLQANRPHRLLGSRWLISTKGVFLGLQLGMIGLALHLGPVAEVGAGQPLLPVALLLASACFLLTNPKE